MSSYSVAQCQLLLIVAFAHLTNSYSSLQYYITPTQNGPCPNDFCLTLSEFAQNSSIFQNITETNVTLSLLPGNHRLDSVLSIANIETFVVTNYYEQVTGEVFVECDEIIGRFDISDITFTYMRGLHFIGCGGNMVTKVDHVVLVETTFQRVHDGHSVLLLNEVATTRILNCSFLNNFHNLQQNYDLEHSSIYDLPHFIDEKVNAGGALLATNCTDIYIYNSKFINNTADVGGVLFAINSRLHIISSFYSQNRAIVGGVMFTSNSSVTIDNSPFNENFVSNFGGVLVSYEDLYIINGATFIKNIAGVESGAIAMYNSVFRINNSLYTSNRAEVWSGAMLVYHSDFHINNTNFSNNSAHSSGGVIILQESKLAISNSKFTNNSSLYVGVLEIYYSVVDVDKTTFFNNYAVIDSGVIWCHTGEMHIVDSTFSHNRADEYGGVMLASNCTIKAISCAFDKNVGSIYVVTSKLVFSGYTKIENSHETLNRTTGNDLLTFHEGGAITSLKSTVTFAGVSRLINNKARDGGAIFASGSQIFVKGKTTISNNEATNSNGGGIFLYQSELEVKGNCDIFHNVATNGGGIYASSSYVTVFQHVGILNVSNNYANNGGGMYLEVNPKLYLLRSDSSATESILIFTSNHANYGGAVYVEDGTNSDACLSNTECFIQVLSTFPGDTDFLKPEDIVFSKNTATKRGSNLFGGLLDRCVLSPFSEVYFNERIEYSGITYFRKISNLTLESTASLPVQVCFCNDDGLQNCDYWPQPIKVKKGEAFSIFLVAVDHVNNSIATNIVSSITSYDGGFAEGQQTQTVDGNCTQLTFNVFSPLDSETIVLFADGPCGDSERSIKTIDIQFLNCTCPVGFVPCNGKATACECICDPELSPYVSSCDSTNESLLLKQNSRAWISYTNITNRTGYVIYPNCPHDYCHSSTANISINLNLPHAEDKQCAYNRTGILCGACQQNLSLSLGSSRCLPCYSQWPAVLVAICIAAIIAGILLVSLLLVLDMTVAVGLINSFIFYSNIFASISSILLRSSGSTFSSTFFALLNLDIGFDVCFFDGLDTYTKTWLQLAFPVYIISLVVSIIILSEYSSSFAKLIGKVNPVATLATLILLSYTKLLSITITALSFVVLHYPDGSREIVWLADGNVKYFQGKHIPLAIVALLIMLIGTPYTVVLFLWQWIICAPKWKVFKWSRNSRLIAFIATYHAPYNSKYRYWTGLLLIVRVILYITASFSVSANPQTTPLTIIMLIGGLLLLKGSIGVRVYKKSIVDILDTVLYFNLLALAALTLYDFKSDISSQRAIIYISTAVTFILHIVAISYHVFLFIKRKKAPKKSKDQTLTRIPPSQSFVTHSVIEISTPQCPPPYTFNTNNLDEIQESVENRIVSAPYISVTGV